MVGELIRISQVVRSIALEGVVVLDIIGHEKCSIIYEGPCNFFQEGIITMTTEVHLPGSESNCRVDMILVVETGPCTSTVTITTTSPRINGTNVAISEVFNSLAVCVQSVVDDASGMGRQERENAVEHPKIRIPEHHPSVRV